MFVKAYRHDFAKAMTLLELVMTLSIVSLVIPVLLTGTASAYRSYRNLETEACSIRISKWVFDEIRSAWKGVEDSVLFPKSLPFPHFCTASEPLLFVCDKEGNFLKKLTGKSSHKICTDPLAVYLVQCHSEAFVPSHFQTNSSKVAKIHLTVSHPAKAQTSFQKRHSFQLIHTR